MAREETLVEADVEAVAVKQRRSSAWAVSGGRYDDQTVQQRSLECACRTQGTCADSHLLHS